MQTPTPGPVSSSNHRKEQGADAEGQSPPTAHASLAEEATWEPGVPGLFASLFACLFDALMERQAWTGGGEGRTGMRGENHPA